MYECVISELVTVSALGMAVGTVRVSPQSSCFLTLCYLLGLSLYRRVLSLTSTFFLTLGWMSRHLGCLYRGLILFGVGLTNFSGIFVALEHVFADFYVVYEPGVACWDFRCVGEFCV